MSQPIQDLPIEIYPTPPHPVQPDPIESRRIEIEPEPTDPADRDPLEGNSFLLSNKMFLAVFAGIHVFFRLMNWPGSYAWLCLIPLLFSCYYLVQALGFVIRKRYPYALLSLAVGLVFVLVSNKMYYTYFNLVLSLSALALTGVFIDRILKSDAFGATVRSRVYEFLTVVVLIQLIPDQILFAYTNRIYRLRTWDAPLGYSDFRKDHPENDKYDATIDSQFYIWTNRVYNYPQILTVSIMNPDSSSWRKSLLEHPDDTTVQLLSHEQLHFDITELWRRKLQDSVSGSFFKSQLELESTIDHFYRQRDLMQAGYDSLTNHGVLLKEQMQWEQNIHYRLNNP